MNTETEFHLPRLLLLRHGQTQWNLERRLQGGKDSPLTTLGRQHAVQQAEILRNLPGTAQCDAVRSPLGRARETASIIEGHIGVEFRIDDRLREIGIGTWEGREYSDVLARADSQNTSPEQLARLFLNAPDGEGIDSVAERCAAFVENLTRPTIVVSHWIFLLVLRATVQNMPPKGLLDRPQPHGAVVELQRGDEHLHARD